MKEQHYTLLEKPEYWTVKKKCLALTVLVFALIGIVATGSEIAQVVSPSNDFELPVGQEAARSTESTVAEQATTEAEVGDSADGYTITKGGLCRGKAGTWASYETLVGYRPTYAPVPRDLPGCRNYCKKYANCLGYNWKDSKCYVLGQTEQSGDPTTALAAPTDRSMNGVECGIKGSSWVGRRRV